MMPTSPVHISLAADMSAFQDALRQLADAVTWYVDQPPVKSALILCTPQNIRILKARRNRGRPAYRFRKGGQRL